MPIRVYVSPNPTAAFDDSWEQVGTLETTDATINQQAAKALHTNQSGGSVRLEFYLSGDADAHWVRAQGEHSRFGIAFDLLGDGSRILVAESPAAVAPLLTRSPEPHPGLMVRPVMLGIKVNSRVNRI